MECCACGEGSYYFGLTACEHKAICSTCWFKIKLFQGDSKCPVCRQDSEYTIITSDALLKYREVVEKQWGDTIPGFNLDSRTGLYIQDMTEFHRLLSLDWIRCPSCYQAFERMAILNAHLSNVHQERLCTLCVDHSMMFMYEQTLYTEETIHAHLQNSHQKCALCPKKYCYDDKDLLEHLREKHFMCEHCPPERKTAYATDKELFNHLRASHYVCEFTECRRVFVFPTYELLAEHYREIHASNPPLDQLLSFKTNEDTQQMPVQDAHDKRFTVPVLEEVKTKEEEFPSMMAAPPMPQLKRADIANIKKEERKLNMAIKPTKKKPVKQPQRNNLQREEEYIPEPVKKEPESKLKFVESKRDPINNRDFPRLQNKAVPDQRKEDEFPSMIAAPPMPQMKKGDVITMKKDDRAFGMVIKPAKKKPIKQPPKQNPNWEEDYRPQPERNEAESKLKFVTKVEEKRGTKKNAHFNDRDFPSLPVKPVPEKKKEEIVALPFAIKEKKNKRR